MGRPCATVVLLDSSQENTSNQEAIERHDALIALIASGFFFGPPPRVTVPIVTCERGNETEE